ncbi:membrane protein of unknown function [Streptomyces sp. KY70]|nr:membrane protein of unknown function [Streptomyces sp. KY70]
MGEPRTAARCASAEGIELFLELEVLVVGLGELGLVLAVGRDEVEPALGRGVEGRGQGIGTGVADGARGEALLRIGVVRVLVAEDLGLADLDVALVVQVVERRVELQQLVGLGIGGLEAVVDDFGHLPEVVVRLALHLDQARHRDHLPRPVELVLLGDGLQVELVVLLVRPRDHPLQRVLGLRPLGDRVGRRIQEALQGVLDVRVVVGPVGQAQRLRLGLGDLRRGALLEFEACVDLGVDRDVTGALGDHQGVLTLGVEHQRDRAGRGHLLVQEVDARLERLALGVVVLRGHEGVGGLDDALLAQDVRDVVAEGALGDLDLDPLGGAGPGEVGRGAELLLPVRVTDVRHSPEATDQHQGDDQAGAAVAALLLALAAPALNSAAVPARGAGGVVVRVIVVVAGLTGGGFVGAGEERMRLFPLLVRVPVRRRLLLLLGRLAAARRLRRGVGLGGAVVVVRFAVAGLLLGVRVLRLGPVRHGGLLPGVPAATVVLRLGGGLLTVRVLLLRAVLVLVLILLLVRLLRAVLLVLVVRLLLRVLLVVLALVLLVVLVLLGVRVLRIGLLLVAVLALAVVGLTASPSLVPVQGVLGMPRFGAGAPAILSHRSPRAARRRSVSSLRCAVFVRTTDASRGTLPYRDQTTTSTPSPGGLPDARSDSRAF